MERPVKTVTRAELDGMLRHILRCPEVMSRALSKIELADFDQVTEKGHKLIYAIAKDFYTDHKRLIPVDLLYTEIQSRTHNQPDFDANTVNTILELAYYFFTVPVDDKDLVASWALSTLESFLYQRRVGTRMVQHAEQYGSGGPDILDELREIRTQSSVQIGKEIIPFGLTPLLGTTPRSPTGIQFIDVVLGGGTRGGELYGFLAPSGGGKTSLSHQIGVNGARRKRHIFTFSYEESPMTNEYMVPLYSCATGMSRAVFDKVNPLSEMTPEQLEKLERARQEIGTYLHYVDMSGSFDNAGRGGAHELDAYIIEQRHAGIQPHGIIIDWLWPLFQRHYSDYKVDRKRILEERGLAQRLMDEFKSVASRHNCWIWLNHQVAPAATSKKTPAGWTDAAEFKSFAWLVNVCIALGTLDDKQIAPFNCSKNRNFRTSKTYVQLKGEISTFFPMGKDMEYSSRTKNYVEVGQGTCTPDMAAPGEPTAQMEPTFDKVRANYEGNDRIDL